MSLCKRGGVWWIDVRTPAGERVRRTTGTANKALAQELHDRFKSELWRIGHLGDKPQHTWNEAVVHWLKEQSHKATASEDVTKLRWLDQFLGGKELEVLRAILRKCVARAKRDAIVRIAGVGRLGERRDGAAVRTPRCRSLGAEIVGTKKSHVKNEGLASLQALDFWLRGQDLNLRPSGYEPDELPDCSTPR